MTVQGRCCNASAGISAGPVPFPGRAAHSADKVREVLQEYEERDWWETTGTRNSDRHLFTVSITTARSQEVLDAVSEALEGKDDWRLISMATEAALPEPEKEAEEKQRAEGIAASREEIYKDVSANAKLTRDYLLMTALATVVAAIGLNTDQVAVVIGAMVIAPLLGPILAFAFGTALGNRGLLWVAAKSLLAGLAAAGVFGTGLGLVFPVNLDSSLMDFSGAITLTTVALPLASGAAAALMLAGGQTSALVGVMVSAALLPPLAAFGLLLGNAEWMAGLKALATVIINVVAINLAGQLVFVLKGVRPRNYLSDSHQTSVYWSLGVWAGLVALLAIAVYGFGHGWSLIFWR